MHHKLIKKVKVKLEKEVDYSFILSSFALEFVHILIESDSS
jgi:hypothetical protein